MKDFKAYRIDQADGKISAGFTTLSLDDLSAGEMVIRVSYSTINYKDALAATGKGRILRQYPLVGGIDLAGRVISSDTDEFAEGDAVLVNGAGLSETRDGGYAEYAREVSSALFMGMIASAITLIDCSSFWRRPWTRIALSSTRRSPRRSS